VSSEHELAVARFFEPDFRGRWRALIVAGPKARKKLLRGLHHLGHLDPRFATKIPPREQKLTGSPACSRLVVRQNGAT